MDIYEIKESIAYTADSVNYRVHCVLEVQKIKKEIRNKKEKLDFLYKELGRVTYSNHYSDTKDFAGLIEQLCKSIKKLRTEIKKLDRQLKVFNGNDAKSIGKINEKAYKEKDDETEHTDDEVQEYQPPSMAPEPVISEEGFAMYKFCPACLVGNNPEAKKCIYCGEKFN